MKQAALIIAGAIAGGAMLAWSGSQHGVFFYDLPLFAWLARAAFAVQWIAFIPACLKRTEHFYDLVGGSTYFALTAAALALAGPPDIRDTVLSTMVLIWSARLAFFLFRRVRKTGSDARFDEIKASLPRFLIAWTLQGLWIVATAGAAWAAITSSGDAEPGAWLPVGALIWCVGFGIEVAADAQKQAFRSDPENKGDFISSGLWSWSRHPNYLGEIILWIGVAVAAAPALTGWQHVTLISPVFVFILLRYGSGVPILERRADEKWGGQPDYERYKEETPVLVPGL